MEKKGADQVSDQAQRSPLQAMSLRHSEELWQLRKTCPHPEARIAVHVREQVSGLRPVVRVICTDCGMIRAIYDLDPERHAEVSKTLSEQGLGDEIYEATTSANLAVVDERRGAS